MASEYPDSVVCLSTRWTRRFWLKRLFSAYPGGLAGVGLVLLRSVIGIIAAWQGVLCLATKDMGATVRIVGGLAVITGIFLAAGFRTRLASFLIALGTMLAENICDYYHRLGRLK